MLLNYFHGYGNPQKNFLQQNKVQDYGSCNLDMRDLHNMYVRGPQVEGINIRQITSIYVTTNNYVNCVGRSKELNHRDTNLMYPKGYK